MARHELTLTDAAKGGRNRGKLALKLQKQLAKSTGIQMDKELIMMVLSDKTVIATGLYLGVGALKRLMGESAPSNTTTSAQNPILRGFQQSFVGIFGGFLGSEASNSLLAGDLGLDALQAALLVNIMTAGNPTGVLSSLSGIVSKAATSAAATGA